MDFRDRAEAGIGRRFEPASGGLGAGANVDPRRHLRIGQHRAVRHEVLRIVRALAVVEESFQAVSLIKVSLPGLPAKGSGLFRRSLGIFHL